VDFTLGQDMMAWVTQGEIAQRDRERLGASDTGIVLYRQLLQEQIERVERGGEPMEVYRDADRARFIELPQEKTKHGSAQWGRPAATNDGLSRHMPVPELVIELFRQVEELERGGAVLPVGHAPALGRAGAPHREVVLRP
jgi:5,5'-dehydrodivanillate O-demethylase